MIHFELFWALVPDWFPDSLRRFILIPFGSGARMALRWPLEAHSELFWALVSEWISDGLWRLILSCSGLWCQNGSQMGSGGSFSAALGSGSKVAPRWPLEAHFMLFWALVTKWLPSGL